MDHASIERRRNLKGECGSRRASGFLADNRKRGEDGVVRGCDPFLPSRRLLVDIDPKSRVFEERSKISDRIDVKDRDARRPTAVNLKGCKRDRSTCSQDASALGKCRNFVGCVLERVDAHDCVGGQAR